MNRTHRGRDTPPIGFEDRERHQATDCLRKLFMLGYSTLISDLIQAQTQIFKVATVAWMHTAPLAPASVHRRIDCFKHLMNKACDGKMILQRETERVFFCYAKSVYSVAAAATG